MKTDGKHIERFYTIDALRGLAAIFVLISHILLDVSTIGLPIMGMVMFFFDLGQFGVCLFFVISGYIIPFSLDRLDLKTFWKRRFFRLYPAYWFSLICVICIIAAGLAKPYSPQFNENPVLMTLANATMLQPLFGFENIMGIYWSLTYEMFFYLGMTIFLLMGMAQQSVKITVIVFTVAFIHDVVLVRLGYGLPIDMLLFGLMCVGHVLFRVSQQRVSKEVALLCMLVLALLLLATTAPLVTNISRVLAPFVFYVMLKRQWQPRLMVWFGAISYPLYLFHELVIVVIRFSSPYLNMLLWFIGAVLVAWLVHHLIELPFQQLGRAPHKQPR